MPSPDGSPQLLSLKASPLLERKLREKVRSRLAERAARHPGYHRQIERRLKRACDSGKLRSSLRLSEKMRFAIWHRHFEGEATPGLPTMVRAARFVVSRVRKMRRK